VLRLTQITFACDDPQALAPFWAGVLGYEIGAAGDRVFASDPRGKGPPLAFARMPKSPTIELPIHLDVNVPDREAEVQRLLGLGARLVTTKTEEIGELKETWTVLRDPEGNGFCVQGTDPRRQHPYVGNVTFSSAAPRQLGAFWSDALGWPEQEDPEDFLEMLRETGLDPLELESYYATRDPDGTRPRFLFQRREKSRPESYPIHLDFTADDREAEIARLTASGATVVETKTREDQTWTVLRDPEGNPFCVG
jgi:predicted enzyme related to lactoylglutathione lyase